MSRKQRQKKSRHLVRVDEGVHVPLPGSPSPALPLDLRVPVTGTRRAQWTLHSENVGKKRKTREVETKTQTMALFCYHQLLPPGRAYAHCTFVTNGDGYEAIFQIVFIFPDV